MILGYAQERMSRGGGGPPGTASPLPPWNFSDNHFKSFSDSAGSFNFAWKMNKKILIKKVLKF